MKRASRLLAGLTAIVLALAFAPSATATETTSTRVDIPVANGSFETPATADGSIPSWTVRTGPGAEVVLVDDLADDGDTSIRFTTVGGGYSNAASEALPVEPGGQYEISASVHTAGDNPLASVYARVVDASGALLSSTYTPARGAAGQWNRVTHAFTAPDGAAAVHIWLYVGANGVGVHHFDHVTLTQSTPLTETTVLNPGFEQLDAEGKPTDWSLAYGSAAGAVIDTQTVRSGERSLRIHDTSATLAQGMESTRFPVEPEVDYRAVVNLYRVSGTPSVYLRFYDARGALITSSASKMITPFGQWGVAVGDARSPEGAVTATVLLYSAGSSLSDTYYDDISITTSPVTSTLIGPQHTTVNAFTSAIGPRSDGTLMGYVATYGSPAQVTEVDLTTGEALRSTTLPGAAGVWGLAVAPNGDVYAGTLSNGSLYRWNPDAGPAQLLGKPVASESYVNALTIGDDGIVYGGTFPNAHLFAYDPSAEGGFAEALTDFGPAIDGASYARSVAWQNGKLYAGVGTPAGLVELDPSTGVKRSIPYPADFPAAEMIYGIETAGDLLSVRTEFPGHMTLFDPQTDEWTEVAVSSGLIASPASQEGLIYFRDEAGDLVSLDLETRVLADTSADDIPNTRPMGWAPISDPQYSGETLVWFDSRGRLFHYNPANDVHRMLPASVNRIPASIHALGMGGDGRVYSSAYVSGGLAAYDPVSGDLQTFEGALGQIDSFLADGSTLWLGSYTKANLFELDTAAGAEASPERHFDLQHARQDRPMALAKAGDSVVMGTVAEYGVNGGAITVYDPTDPDAEPQVHRDVIADHAVVALASDTLRDPGIVYAGTTVDGGLGSEPTSTQGKVFAFDTRSGEKLWEADGAPGERAVTALTLSPTGTLWGIGVGTIFEMDPSDGRMLRSKKLVEAEPSSFVWMGSAIEIGPDGKIYAFADHQAMQVDPHTLAVMPLLQNVTAYTADLASGSLYYARSSDLYRADISKVLGDAEYSSDASLAEIRVEGALLEGFDPARTDYTVTVPLRDAVPAVRVLASDMQATVRVTRAVDVPGSTTVEVTAADGRTTKEYTIAFGIDPSSTIANVEAPQLSGAARVGAPLTVSAGTWDYADVELEVRWLRDGVQVAEGLTYTPVGADLGRRVSAEVTARVPGTEIAATAASDAKVVRAAGADTPRGCPELPGRGAGPVVPPPCA